jgi:hypothetical protein
MLLKEQRAIDQLMRAKGIPCALNKEGGVIAYTSQNVTMETVNRTGAGLGSKQQADQQKMDQRQ